MNRGDGEKEVQVDFNLLVKASEEYWSQDPFKLEDYKVRDLWEHKELKLDKSVLSVKIPPHSVKVYRFIKK